MNNKLNNHELDMQATIFEATGSPTFAAVFREALAYREADSKPVAVVETSDYFTVSQLTGTEPRRKAIRELCEGGLVIGQKLYASPVLSQPVPNNSKPVAEIVSKHGDPEAFGERELQVIADIRKMPYGTKLYTSPVLGQTPINTELFEALQNIVLAYDEPVKMSVVTNIRLIKAARSAIAKATGESE